MQKIKFLSIVLVSILLVGSITKADTNSDPTKMMNDLKFKFDNFVTERGEAVKQNKGKEFTETAPKKIKRMIEDAEAINKSVRALSKSPDTSETLLPLTTLINLLTNLKIKIEGGAKVSEALAEFEAKLNNEFSELPSKIKELSNTNAGGIGGNPEENIVENGKALKSNGISALLFSKDAAYMLGILSSIFISGFLGWILYRKISNVRVDAIRLQEKLNNLKSSVSSQHINLNNSITNCENSILRIRNSLPPDLTDEILTLKAQIQSLRARDGNSPAIVRNSEPVSSELTVSNYLTQAAGRMVRANSVFMRPETLTQDADGKFVLMQNQRGQYLAIPNLPRFGSAQDYSHFQKFYDCDQPTAGEIIIVEPAIVNQDPASGEWNLAKKGTLQISSR